MRCLDEMFGWHHQLNGHGFGWTPGVGDGQEGLAYCSNLAAFQSDHSFQEGVVKSEVSKIYFKNQ